MTAALCILFVALLGLGTMNDLKANIAEDNKPGSVPHYSLLVVLGAGMAAIVALIALIAGSYGTVIVALILTVLIPISYLMEAVKMVAEMKQAGWGSDKTLKFQPYWVWGRIVLLGMGKWMHIVMCITIVGIPLYNMMKTVTVNWDALLEQVELRQEYEQLHKNH